MLVHRRLISILALIAYTVAAGVGACGFWSFCTDAGGTSRLESAFNRCCDGGDRQDDEKETHDHGVNLASRGNECTDTPVTMAGDHGSRPWGIKAPSTRCLGPIALPFDGQPVPIQRNRLPESASGGPGNGARLTDTVILRC